MDKLKIGDKVKIIKISSSYYGKIGEVISQGNGSCWQVDVGRGIGIYFFDYELEKQ